MLFLLLTILSVQAASEIQHQAINCQSIQKDYLVCSNGKVYKLDPALNSNINSTTFLNETSRNKIKERKYEIENSFEEKSGWSREQ